MGEIVVDFDGGGMDFVVISGSLRLRLMTFVWWIGHMVDLDSSISSGDCRVVTERDCWSSRFWRCGSVISSADRRVGSMGTRGKVWLRGRLVLLLLLAAGRRDWLVGVKGLSETKVDVGLIIPAEEVSIEVVLLEYPCWYPPVRSGSSAISRLIPSWPVGDNGDPKPSMGDVGEGPVGL